MPPRWLRLLIVLFWLTTTGWLLWHDLRPRWLPGEPPLFHVDLVEEVRRKDNIPQRDNWIVERQDEKQTKPYPVFRALTWVDRQEEDAYTLNARLEAPRDPKFHPFYVAKIFKVDLMTSAYCVNRAGQLRRLEATVKARPHWGQSPLLGQFLRSQQVAAQNDASAEQIWLSIWGEVRERQFFAHCRAETASPGKPMQFDLPPVEVSYSGSVLMPLHPVSHIRGLRLGQSWRQPLVDPLRDAFASLPGFSGGVRWLNARVLPRPELLQLDDSETSCLVIEYTNDENEAMGRTWVEQDGERVLQQEAILEDGRWIMKRELLRRSRARIVDPRHD